MTGDIIWMTILMWIVAAAAFAPLGYFIYKYVKKNEDARAEGDSE